MSTDGRDPDEIIVHAPREAPSRTRLALIVAPIICLVVASNVGSALFPTLVDEHPQVLIALNPINRHLVLVSHQIEFTGYLTVATLRLLAPDPFFYFLGWYYGDRAIRWMELRTTSVGRLMRRLEDWFRKAGHVLVVIAPNNPVSLLAGAAGMPFGVFMALNVVGTVGRVLLLYWVGDLFSGPIDWFLDLVREYRPWFLALSVGAVAFTVWREMRQGTSEIQQLANLEDELAAVDADEHPPAGEATSDPGEVPTASDGDESHP